MIDPVVYGFGIVFGAIWQYCLDIVIPNPMDSARTKAISLRFQVIAFALCEIFLWKSGVMTGVLLTMGFVTVPKLIERANNE